MKTASLSKIITNIKNLKSLNTTQRVNPAGKSIREPNVSNRSLKFSANLPEIVNSIADSNLNQPTYVYEVN